MTDTTVVQPTLPGTGTDHVAELKAANEARAAAEKKLADIEARSKKDSDTKSAAEKKSADEKAIADGKATETLAAQAAQLKAIQDKADTLEAETRKRIEAKIAKLPESSKKKIAAIRDVLPVDKLWAFVDAEADDVEALGGIPGGTPGGTSGGAAQKISPEATKIVKAQGHDTTMAEKMVLTANPENPGQVKRVLPVEALIVELQQRRPNAPIMSAAEGAKRHAAGL